MAFTAIVAFGRALTDSEKANTFNYVKDQMASGNTDGLSYGVTKTGLEHGLVYGDLRARDWQTQDQANAWVAFCNTFTPAPTWAQVIIPGESFIIEVGSPPA